MDGHRGLVPPDPISNSAVKKASVLFGTVLLYGKNRKLSTLFFYKNIKPTIIPRTYPATISVQ